ncbi:MAG TPA: hypothetical protein VM597_17850 [Gemmataceae bacterium]|jgi:hypothetical protein|nr:hypothetical protein [Gemmataceae bacterium]
MTPRICPHSGLTLYPVYDRHGKVRWVTIPTDGPPTPVRPVRAAARARGPRSGPTGNARRTRSP